MRFDIFLTRVIDDALVAVRRDYTHQSQAALVCGSVAGLDACRGIALADLVPLYDQALVQIRRRGAIEEYWYWRGYLQEVEWLMNVVSAVLINEGKPPVRAGLPTVRAYRKAAEVLGVDVEVTR